MLNLLVKLKAIAFFMLALFFSFICVLTLLLHGWAVPFPRFTPQKPLLLLSLVLLFFFLFLFINWLSIKIARRSNVKFLYAILTFYFAIQIAFIVLFPVNAYEDAVLINKFALQFLQGDFNSLRVGNYLGYYPNNIGITLFIWLVYSILPKSYITLRIINAVFNTVSAWLIYRLYREFYPERAHKASGLLILAVTFVPPIILNNFTYGDIICNTLCLAAILNAIKYVKLRAGIYAVLTALFLMLANFMRGVALLFLVAIVFYWVLKLKPGIVSLIKGLAYSAFCIIIFNLPLKLFSLIGYKAGILAEPVGIHSNPIWRWINMGFPGKKLGYWDGGRNTGIFVSKFKCNKHDSAIFFINELVEKTKKTGLINVLKAYFKKVFWLWSEGTYTINFYGLSQALGANNFILYSTPLVKYIEPWDKVARLSLDWALHSFNWLVIALVSLYLFNAATKKDFRMELFVYIIFAYIGFYMLWEVKSRYLFGVYPIFLIMSYCCSERIYDYLSSWLFKVRAFDSKEKT